MTDATDDILTACDHGVFTITLNRPEALNAFTPPMLERFVAAVKAAEDNEAARVIILEGAGRAFSAGVDLKVLQGETPVAGKVGAAFDGVAFEAANAIRRVALPVIAKVHGACFTGALEIALQCDFIIAESKTKFGDTHAKWALRPTWGMSQNLARAVGVRRARELSYTAEVFSGEDAFDWGLANHAVDGVEALDALVLSKARAIAEASPGAVAAYKDLYRLHEENRPLEDALAEETARDYPQITDTAERLKAFGA